MASSSPATPELSAAAPEKRLAPSTRRYITAALMLLMALAAMESTVTATAMYSIIKQLHGLELYAWVPAVYLLACTITMPLYGRLADILGRKRVLIAAVCLFTIGSLLSSLAASIPQLIIFRAIQGLGAGGIMPVVLTILGDIYTIEERARIQGAFSSVWGVSSLAGPALGAALVATLGWRSIFWVNLPFGFMGLAVLLAVYHDREKPHSTELDLAGAGALALGSTALLLFLSNLGTPHHSWIGSILSALVALLSLTFFFTHERRIDNPIISPRLLAQPAIGFPVLASILVGMCIFTLDTYVPYYIQGARGGSVAAGAGAVTPVMMCWAISAMIAAPLIVRWGFRRTATIGACFILLGFTGLFVGSLFEAPQWMLTIVLALTGLGFGPTTISSLLGAQDAVTWQYRGSVTSQITFGRTIGGAIGVGLLGSVLNFVISDKLAFLESKGLKASDLLDTHAATPGKTAATIPAELQGYAHHMLSHGLVWVFGLMLVFAVMLLLAVRRIPRKKSTQAITPTEALEAGV